MTYFNRDPADSFYTEPDEPTQPAARSTFDIVTRTEDHVTVHCWTNDDRDLGYPSKTARWDLEFHTDPRKSALDKALEHTGETRQGVLCHVTVTLDGQQI